VTQISDIAQPIKAILFEEKSLIIKKIKREISDFITMSYTRSVIADIPNILKRAANVTTCPGGYTEKKSLKGISPFSILSAPTSITASSYGAKDKFNIGR
jgi:hypothetical protein